jgi:hypothetical protein
MVFGVLNGMVVVHPAPLNNNPNGPKRQAVNPFRRCGQMQNAGQVIARCPQDPA